MIGPLLVVGGAMGIVVTGALVLDWLENRRDWAEWWVDNEPPSRLDNMDNLKSPDELRP